MSKQSSKRRADHTKGHRGQYERNRARLLKTSTHCALCGGELYPNLKWPHPLSSVCDHIISISIGGHPSDLSNLQIVHNQCNTAKSNKLYAETLKDNSKDNEVEIIGNKELPLSINWAAYKADTGNGESNQEKLEQEANEIKAKGNEIYSNGIVRARKK